MAGFLRLVLALLLAPACWGAAHALVKTTAVAAGLTAGVLSFIGGMAAFVALWLAVGHPVKTYVLGHELTHAMTGMMFGAVPSRLRVSDRGGSVNLTKSNIIITLSPYFIPFYTLVVLAAALVTGVFVKPLPWPLAWVFAVGFTWAFHVVFTVDSLSRPQPDVREYGRLFSWTFIFLANVVLVLVALAAVNGTAFVETARTLFGCVWSAYAFTWTLMSKAFSHVS